jgi:hypothetical protein
MALIVRHQVLAIPAGGERQVEFDTVQKQVSSSQLSRSPALTLQDKDRQS